MDNGTASRIVFILSFSVAMVIVLGAGFVPVAAAAVDVPMVVWQECLGGSELDGIGAIDQTADGGYVVVGATNATYGDIPEQHDESDVWATIDFWVTRLDATGGPVWQRCLGGSRWDNPTAVQQTADGGYVVVGYTRSNDGDVAGNHGGVFDGWVVKLDATGDLLWQRCLGGTAADAILAVQQTVDGGFVVAGETWSNDGDVAGNHGAADAWVARLNATGAVVWQRCLGGTSGEYARAVRQTADGGYIVAGTPFSTDGDLTGYDGSGDYWVVKLDATGDLVWQKTLGGSDFDDAYAVRQTLDGDYIVAGYTVSTDGDVTGNHGSEDYWVVKLNATGDLLWQTCLGGSNDDRAYAVGLTSDGGVVLVGWTSSTDGDVTGFHGGGGDAWLVKLNATGGLAWQRSLGGTNNDSAGAVQQTADGGYIIAGTTNSTDGDVAGYLGGLADGWVVKVSAVSPVPGGAGVPADTNADGLYDDVNGNSRKDFADVVLYFNQMSWMSANEPAPAFDYNDNGRIDFADVVWLFNHL